MVKCGSGENSDPVPPPSPLSHIYPFFFLFLSEKPLQDAAEDNPLFPGSLFLFLFPPPNSFSVLIIFLLLLWIICCFQFPVPVPQAVSTPY